MARGYGDRRDLETIAEAIADHLGLSPERATTNAIVQMIAAMIVSLPDTVERLVAGQATPEGYRQFAIDAASDIASPEDLLDPVLADVRRAVSNAR